MAIHIRDPRTDSLVRELARKRGIGLTEAIALAVETELALERREPSLRDKLRKLQADVASRGSTGLKADKAFFDDLSGQPDE